MRLTIEIDLDDDGLARVQDLRHICNPNELTRVLRQVVDGLSHGKETRELKDTNGNTVGRFDVKREDQPCQQRD